MFFYTFFLFLCFFISSSFSQDETMIVNAHREFEIYVMPTAIINNTEHIDAYMDPQSVLGYASVHKHYAKKSSLYGYVPMGNHIFLYNKDTIKYTWDDCDYIEDPRGCTFKNDHWLLESTVVVNKNQVIISMYLYDEHLQIISKGTVTNNFRVKYIPRQKITSANIGLQNRAKKNCGPTGCTLNKSGQSKNKSYLSVEDLPPTKIEINPKFLDKDVHQASMMLWCSLKIDI